MLFWELDYKELYEKEIPVPPGAVYPVEVRCVWGVEVRSVQFQADTDGNFVRDH